MVPQTPSLFPIGQKIDITPWANGPSDNSPNYTHLSRPMTCGDSESLASFGLKELLDAHCVSPSVAKTHRELQQSASLEPEATCAKD